jgi:hypothetical protein
MINLTKLYAESFKTRPTLDDILAFLKTCPKLKKASEKQAFFAYAITRRNQEKASPCIATRSLSEEIADIGDVGIAAFDSLRDVEGLSAATLAYIKQMAREDNEGVTL